MIFPILSGFAPMEKAPLTWILMLGLMVSFMQSQPLNQYTNNEFKELFQDQQFLEVQGRIYKTYLESTASPMSGEISSEISEELGSEFLVEVPQSFSTHELQQERPLAVWGQLAFQNSQFLRKASKAQWPGDQVAIAHWKEKLLSFEELKSFYPAHKLGVSEDGHPWLSFLTYQFVHDGWMHLLGNLLLLYMIGGFLEKEGWGRLMVFSFLSGGVASALFYALILGLKSTPLIGASGSVCSLIGLFVGLYGFKKTNVLYFVLPMEGYYGIKNWKTVYWAPWLFILEDLTGWLSRSTLYGGGVEHFIHLGGCAYGLAIGLAVSLLISSLDLEKNLDAGYFR